MGQYVRWQVMIAFIGIIFLAVYLGSIQNLDDIRRLPTEDDDNRFREGVVGKPQFLNPLLAVYNSVDQDITSLLFEGLVRDDGLGNLKPVLARDWTVSDDGLVYTFTLRRDVVWSDGLPFTSDDVIFTFILIQSNDFPGDPSWQRLWQSVEIEAIGRYTVQFILSEPFPALIYYTTVGILPKHILDNIQAQDLLTHPFNLSPVGTGPFKLVEATDHHLSLEANPRYHGGSAQITRVEFKFYADTEALYQAFQSREIDSISRVSTKTLSQLQQQPDAQFFSAPMQRYDIVYFNLQAAEARPFFQDRLVRQALLQLLDRQTLIDDVLRGQGILATGPIPPWSWAYNPNQPQLNYDPVGGIELLETAGWLDADNDGLREQNGTPLQFTLLVRDDPVQIAIARNIAQQWEAAQMAVTVEVVGDDLTNRLSNRQFDAALVEAQFLGDPDLYPYWHQMQIERGQNFAGWEHEAASRALEQGRTTVDRNKRIKPYYEFQHFFAEETPALILYYPVYTYVIRNRVENVQLASLVTPSDRFRSIQDWSLLTPQPDTALTSR